MHKYAALMDEVVAAAAKTAIHKAEHVMKDMDADGPDSDELEDLTHCVYILDMTDKIMSRHYPEQVEHTTQDTTHGTTNTTTNGVVSVVSK